MHRLNPQSSLVTVSASWIRQRGDLAITGGFLYDKESSGRGRFDAK